MFKGRPAPAAGPRTWRRLTVYQSRERCELCSPPHMRRQGRRTHLSLRLPTVHPWRTHSSLLPMSMLALRVVKADPHEGHDHPPKKTKRIKGQWNVRTEPQQEAKEEMYYVWFYEGSQIMRRGIRRSGPHRNLCARALSAVAAVPAARCLLPQLGVPWPAGLILRHGNIPGHSLLHHLLRRIAWSLVVPEPVGGCLVPGQLQARLGLAMRSVPYPDELAYPSVDCH